MSGFFGDPSAIIAHIGSAIGSLAPAPAPQSSFAPGQGPGLGGFAPAPLVAGSNAWPTVTIGGGGFQPAQMQAGSFQPSGGMGGGFQPSAGLGGGFQPSGGIGGSPFTPSAQNPLLAPPKPAATSTTTPGSGVATYTGLKPDVAKWAGQVQSTFADLGGYVPDAMLAIIQHESSGNPDIQNQAGYPAYGLFQLWEQPGLSADQQFQQAHALAVDKLKMINDAYARLGLNPDDRTRARDLFLAWAGQFDPATAGPSGARDVGSGEDANAFLNGPNGIMPMYDNIVRGKQQGGTSIPAGPALQTIFGGTQPPSIMQEFGQTDYSTSHESTYTYGTSYGLPPGTHPGVDYGMARGTSLYVPVDGTVVYGGGTGYYTDNNGDGPGHGELLIQLANGDQIIMGHMSQINLQPGQHVTAGMLAGLSGGSDGDHLHLEVRVKDPSMPSGYRIIDPRVFFGQR